jgi:hypothetical protein
MACTQHLKLISHDTSFGHAVFSDWYRFGDSQTEEVPLIIYVGGAISLEEYRKRETTEPLQVVQEFSKAVGNSELSCIDLLVLPFPPEPDAGVHQQLFSVLILDLLRQTPNPRPSLIGCVGNSIGASFASYLTFSLKQVKALATLGGYGMVEGANDSNMVGEVAERAYRCWWNADSPGYMENLFFLQLLIRYDVDMEIVTGSGGHDFADYAANGAVQEAFKFVIGQFRKVGGF